MTDSEGRGDPKTDVPPLDLPTELRVKRDEFVQTFFKKGAEFTEELLHENERLHKALTDVEAENATLRKQLASDAAIRDLLSKIDELEREKAQILSHQNAADAVSTRFAARYSAIEEELSMLANVYVASYQLNATFKLELVLRHVNELLGQLVGSRSHALYLHDEAKRELVCVTAEGLKGREPRRLVVGEPAPANTIAAVIERVFLTGVSFFAEDPHEARESGHPDREPAACVAIRLDERIVGVIVVYAVLEQKLTFMPVDFELFKLLSVHAGTAIFGAQLYEAAGHRIPPPRALTGTDR